ncbi:MAG: SMC-Scp complex subunit ScpB, partial [Planctomycetaceae bacterium]|nr:SMC-Scp complex subunit ScpB [Planctomycetaceae bacterium]
AAESVEGLAEATESSAPVEDGDDGAWEQADAEAAVESAAVDSGEADPADTTPAVDDAPRVTPRQIVEALLFVGGRPLTSRQIADVLGGSHTPDRVDDLVSDLNREYARQQRPYEMRLGEGGYRLQVTAPYEKVRARVFGIGPREVKLAQNALEVLALVAYQQPVSREEVEATGIKGAAGLLRQLLRRQLVELHRGEDGTADTYRTTDRFLELFGLRSLKDLPRPEAVNLR